MRVFKLISVVLQMRFMLRVSEMECVHNCEAGSQNQSYVEGEHFSLKPNIHCMAKNDRFFFNAKLGY